MSSASIHPTAVVHPKAKLGEGCEVGPFCVIGEHVTLGASCKLHSHVVVDGQTTLGAGNELFPFAAIGLKTQDLKWKGGVTRTVIGDHNVFRENTTVHSATNDGDATVIGSHNHFLAYTHIAHDCVVGSHIVMSNVGTLAGHVIVEDHAIIGGCSKVVQDVPPFMLADGNPAETKALNKVGLERNGVSEAAQAALKKAFKILFREGLTVSNALAKIEQELPVFPELQHLIAFVKASERGISK